MEDRPQKDFGPEGSGLEDSPQKGSGRKGWPMEDSPMEDPRGQEAGPPDRPGSGRRPWPGLLASLPLSIGAVLGSRAQALAAVQGLGKIGENISQNLPGLAKLLFFCGLIFGLYLIISGFMELYGSSRRQGSVASGIFKCALGACLLALETMVGAFSATIFGGSASESGLDSLEL
jgi:hypothetical protein